METLPHIYHIHYQQQPLNKLVLLTQKCHLDSEPLVPGMTDIRSNEPCMTLPNIDTKHLLEIGGNSIM